MNNLLDIFFHFPNTEGAGKEFVSSILGSLSVPALAIDAQMEVKLSNLPGHDVLLRARPRSRGKGRKPGARGFPASLTREVRACLKKGRSKIVAGFAVPGERGDIYDLVLCPGRVEDSGLCFVVMLPLPLDPEGSDTGVVGRFLESFDCAAAAMNTELKLEEFNQRLLTTYDVTEDEVRGRKFSERSDSEQAKVTERQIAHNMATRSVTDDKVQALATTRRGVTFTTLKAWPLLDSDGGCHGTVGLMNVIPSRVAVPAVDEARQTLFGKIALVLGPPLIFTHLDGNIVAMSAAAKALLGVHDDDYKLNLKTALPWANPDIIERVYDDIVHGSEYGAVLTEVNGPTGTRLFRLSTYALKDVGDITSEVLIHMLDITEEERIRNRLAETARNLATEKEILDRVFERVKVAYAIVDRELTVLRVSESVVNRFGLDLSFFVGKKTDEIDPTTRESGIITYVKTAIDHGQELHMERLPYTVFTTGEQVFISLGFYPMNVDGKQVCLIVGRNMTAEEEIRAKYDRQSNLYELALQGVEEGIMVHDRHGNVVQVNHVFEKMVGKKKDNIIGKHVSSLVEIEESALIADFLHRSLVSRQHYRTGCLKFTNKATGEALYLDTEVFPWIAPDGSLEGVMAVVHFVTRVMNLEKQVEEYTQNLEKLVNERTKELVSANALLEDTVRKVESMARSGMILSSLKDTESVMKSFLKESRDVLGADFVSVGLIEASKGTSKTTYYSSGDTPLPGEAPTDIVEKGLSQVSIGQVVGEEVRQPRENLLIVDFVFPRHRGILWAWKRGGAFTPIDQNLGKLLSTQLSFSLPITEYVFDLRLERDRSRTLRQIAFRVASMSSVGGAIAIVAQELSKIISADRFFWVVSDNDNDVWVREIYSRVGRPTKGPVRAEGSTTECIRPILTACHDSHRRFCERFPRFGQEGYAPGEPGDSDLCPFAVEEQSGSLAKCMRRILGNADLLGWHGGSVVVVPVTLSARSRGMLCAYNEVGTPFSREDVCFMCLAAATVGHMWEAADAASNIRRLKAAGQTVSELAHDFKYPLMRIRDLAANIASESPEAAGQGPALEGISDEVERLVLLAQELVDISNVVGRQYELIDVADIVEHCVSLTSSDSSRRSVEVRTSIESPLPPVFANTKDLRTVFLHLLANSIEAAGRGGFIDIDVRQAKTESGEDCLRVTFEDSGPGVPEAERKKIFDPFYSSKEGGSGLGLFSAKKRANANGGDVVCEAGTKGQCRFVLRFPLASG